MPRGPHERFLSMYTQESLSEEALGFASKGDLDSALQLVRQARAESPSAFDPSLLSTLLLSRARSLLKEGHLEAAENAAREARGLRPGPLDPNDEAGAVLASILRARAFATGSRDGAGRALECLLEALALSHSPELRTDILNVKYVRARELYGEGRHREAELYFRDILVDSPPDSEASLNARNGVLACLQQRAIAAFNAGDHPLCESLFRHALSLRPGEPTTLEGLSTTLQALASKYHSEGAYEEAVRVLDECLRLTPQRPGLLTRLEFSLHAAAMHKTQQGMWKESLIFLRSLAILSPENLYYLLLLGVAEHQKGHPARALEIARQLYQHTPLHADTLGLLCQTLLNNGLLDESAKVARQYVARLQAGDTTSIFRPDWILLSLGEHFILRQNLQEGIHFFAQLASNPVFQPTVVSTVLADLLLAAGRIEEAGALLAPHAQSTWSRTFVSASICEFQRTLRDGNLSLPSRKLRSEDCDALAVSCVRCYGRFGHQLHEYISVRLYCEAKGLQLETPDWVGHYLFEVDDVFYEPGRFIRRNNAEDVMLYGLPDGEILANVDAWAPGSTPQLSPEQLKSVRAALKIREIWLPKLTPPLEALRRKGDTIVAIHLRRGDRVQMNDVTHTSLYLDWLARLWPTLTNPVLYLASDDIDLVKPDFASFSPVSLSDIATPWGFNDYLQDFYVLMNCDVLGISTGSFAQAASWLNARAKIVVRPSPDGSSLVDYSPATTS